MRCVRAFPPDRSNHNIPPMNVSCTQCRAVFETADSNAGNLVTCPSCGKPVPASPQEDAAPQGYAAMPQGYAPPPGYGYPAPSGYPMPTGYAPPPYPGPGLPDPGSGVHWIPGPPGRGGAPVVLGILAMTLSFIPPVAFILAIACAIVAGVRKCWYGFVMAGLGLLLSVAFLVIYIEYGKYMIR